MAVKSRKSSTWQTLHFFARFLGLTGAVAACVGAFIWSVLEETDLGTLVVAAGLAAVVFALLIELRVVAGAIASRRGAFGINVVLQIVVMLVLVVGVNVYSFDNYRRIDLTRERVFTLDPGIVSQLAQLRGDTEIIVLQQYVSFGQRAEFKQDKYDFAAQRKIVEKVKDLAEQFKDFGPRFRVTILDVQDDYYQEKLEAIRKMSADLAQAIEKAPENSIFFYSKDQKQIQRLSFSDIYQLDKQSSMDGNNLVLKYQGAGPFARKIFNIEEKKPHVALAIIHPLLGFLNQDEPKYTMSGAKKVLNAYGFASTDIMLRKLSDDGNLTEEPTVLTYDESRYEQIEDELVETDDSIKQLRKELGEFNELYKEWSESSLAELNKKYIYVILEDGRQGVRDRKIVDSLKKSKTRHKLLDVDEDDRKMLTSAYKHNSEVVKHVLDTHIEDRESLIKEKATLRVENLAEKRRVTDVEAKAKAMLANVDLLIIPRITMLNGPSKWVIPNRVHKLDNGHLNAIKAYLKEGKPVLFLLGPTNLPQEAPEMEPQGDPLEAMLSELGFKLPKQAILYNIESKEYNERKITGAFGKSAREIEVPSLKFDDTTETGLFTKTKEPFAAHPIRTSLKLMSRATGSKDAQAVSVRHPRPVYHLRTVLPPDAAASLVGRLALPGLAGPLQGSATWLNKIQQKQDENSVIMVTREESWNEENPYIVKGKVPRFTPTKDDDPAKGTVEEVRRGPFPIGVAVETQLPASWYESDKTKPQKVRLAVIGSGGAFVGPTLPPLKEKMFLDVVNWLMGRDDLLARDNDTWQYPRVAVKSGSVEFHLWSWGARLGLPLVFVYLGTVVWMVRRMR